MIYLFISVYLTSLMLVDTMEELNLALYSVFKLKMCTGYISSFVEFEKLMPNHKLSGCLTMCILVIAQVQITLDLFEQ